VLGIDHHIVAWQMRRQGAVIAGGAGGFRPSLPSAGCFGSILGRLMLGGRLLQIFEPELQLIGTQLFGPAAELVTREALDQQPQLVILGMQLAQHLLQDRGIVR
jgi:hypothetical protein